MRKLNSILEYKRIYANWISALYYVHFRNKNIIKIKIRNGKDLAVPKEMVYIVKELVNSNKLTKVSELDFSDGILTFQYLGKIVKMKFYRNGILNGELASFLGDYDFLEPIKGNTLIDVGANIADSSVWFAIRDAFKVIALEPYRWNYNMAIQNIELNHLKDRIVMLNAGYGPDGEIEIEDTIANIGTVLKEFKGGITIPLITLKSLLLMYGKDSGGDLLLKMDCEGCEYNILKEEESTLIRFSKILIEYHNGYENLVEKLKKCGFVSEYTKPHTWYDETTKRNFVQGYLYAHK